MNALGFRDADAGVGSLQSDIPRRRPASRASHSSASSASLGSGAQPHPHPRSPECDV